MPVTYQIDKAKQLVRTSCTGATTLDEVLGHFAELLQDPECPHRLNVLLDLSEMTSLPASEQLRTVAGEIGRIVPQVQFLNCAIIAPRDALFGMARMFEVFAEQHFAATRVFRTRDEGASWLDSLMVPFD
jgi:hypothetical protein